MRSANSDSFLSEKFSTTSGFGGRSELITKERVGSRQVPVRKGSDISRYRVLAPRYFDFTSANITGRTTDTRVLGAIPKVLLRKTGDTLIAAFDSSGEYPEQSLYFFTTPKQNSVTSVLWGF